MNEPSIPSATGGAAPTRPSNAIGVCILAAGLAKRLAPLSTILAKPAFPLGGCVPIVEPWVRKFVRAGITDIAMNLHRVPESIRSHFGNGRAFGAHITYVFEETPSGTLGGAIKMVRALQKRGLRPERVFIPSGDIISEIGVEQLQRMMELHRERGAAFTAMLAPIPWSRRKDYGTAVLEGFAPERDVAAGCYARIERFLEKVANSPSNENNASNYLVETDWLLELESHLTPAEVGVQEPCYDFGKHVLAGMTGAVPHLAFLARRGRDLYGYEPGRPWFDVGQKRDYLEVNQVALQGGITLDLPYKKVEWGWQGEDVEMDPASVTIRPPVLIGNGCTIAPGAVIGPYASLADGWVVKRQATIANSVLWPRLPHAALPPGTAREIGEGVAVESSIVAGGKVDRDLREKTAHPLPDGALAVQELDWAEGGERA